MSETRKFLAVGLLALLPACAAREPEAAPPAPAETAAAEPAADAAPLTPQEILERKLRAGPVVGPPAGAPASELMEQAQAAYGAAREAVLGRDFVTGIARLREAVELDPGFGEAWYQLGETHHGLAMQLAETDAAQAVEQERQALSALLRARDLLAGASVRTVNAFDLHELRESTDRRLAQIDPLPELEADIVQRLRDLAVETAGEPPTLEFDLDEEEAAPEEAPEESAGAAEAAPPGAA